MFKAVKKFIVSLFTQTQQLSNAPDASLSDDVYQSIRQIVDPLETKKESLSLAELGACTFGECGSNNMGVINLLPDYPTAYSHSNVQSSAEFESPVYIPYTRCTPRPKH